MFNWSKKESVTEKRRQQSTKFYQRSRNNKVRNLYIYVTGTCQQCSSLEMVSWKLRATQKQCCLILLVQRSLWVCLQMLCSRDSLVSKWIPQHILNQLSPISRYTQFAHHCALIFSLELLCIFKDFENLTGLSLGTRWNKLY